jgi:hypothetical protein
MKLCNNKDKIDYRQWTQEIMHKIIFQKTSKDNIKL